MVIALTSVVQGSVGFGVALLAAPFLVWLEPRLVPGPLILSSTLLTVLVAYRDRGAMDLKGVGLALVGRIPGTLVGAWLLTRVAGADLGVLFGALIVLGCATMAFGPPVRPTQTALLVAGFVSGVMGTSSSIGGPPMALLYQHEAGTRMRSTLAVYFTLGAILSLVILALVGRFGSWELEASALLAPGVFLGFLLSSRTARWLDRGRLRQAVLLTAGLAGAALIAARFIG